MAAILHFNLTPELTIFRRKRRNFFVAWNVMASEHGRTESMNGFGSDRGC